MNKEKLGTTHKTTAKSVTSPSRLNVIKYPNVNNNLSNTRIIASQFALPVDLRNDLQHEDEASESPPIHINIIKNGYMAYNNIENNIKKGNINN